MRKILYLIVFLIGLWAVLVLMPGANQLALHPYYQGHQSVEVIAHRAGRGEMPDSTLQAAEKAYQIGSVLELDVHRSLDGVLLVRHDTTVDATTNGSGLIKQKNWRQLQQLDAGYQFEPENNYPFRDKGIRISSLERFFKTFPDARYVLEIKQLQPSITVEFCQLLKKYQLKNQVVVGSFSETELDKFRDQCPGFATSMSAAEVARFVLLQKIGLSHLVTVKAQVMQVPINKGFIDIVTPPMLETARKRGMKVEVWTVNETKEMQQMIELQVDGIITDYPKKLNAILSK